MYVCTRFRTPLFSLFRTDESWESYNAGLTTKGKEVMMSTDDWWHAFHFIQSDWLTLLTAVQTELYTFCGEQIKLRFHCEIPE